MYGTIEILSMSAICAIVIGELLGGYYEDKMANYSNDFVRMLA